MASNIIALNGYEYTPFYETRPPRKPQTLRSRLEEEIDRLIDMLNAMDGDPDFEDNADIEAIAFQRSPQGRALV